MDTEEIMEINMEGIMDLENNLATTIVIIVLGKNHQDAKINGWMFDKKQEFYIVWKYLPQDSY